MKTTDTMSHYELPGAQMLAKLRDSMPEGAPHRVAEHRLTNVEGHRLPLTAATSASATPAAGRMNESPTMPHTAGGTSRAAEHRLSNAEGHRLPKAPPTPSEPVVPIHGHYEDPFANSLRAAQANRNAVLEAIKATHAAGAKPINLKAALNPGQDAAQ